LVGYVPITLKDQLALALSSLEADSHGINAPQPSPLDTVVVAAKRLYFPRYDRQIEELTSGLEPLT
jgi:hypothetical protein